MTNNQENNQQIKGIKLSGIILEYLSFKKCTNILKTLLVCEFGVLYVLQYVDCFKKSFKQDKGVIF